MKNKLLILPILIMLIAAGCAAKIKNEQPTTRPSVTTIRPTTTEATQMSTATTTENYTVVTETTTKVLTTKKRFYKVTSSELPFDYERELIASVVMNEAGYECYEGKCAVAQCVLNACAKAEKKFSEIRWDYGYKYEKTPTDAVLKAVDDVFLNGVRVTDEPILYYYNPAYGYSSFHESQSFVMAIEHHRFFKRRGN